MRFKNSLTVLLEFQLIRTYLMKETILADSSALKFLVKLGILFPAFITSKFRNKIYQQMTYLSFDLIRYTNDRQLDEILRYGHGATRSGECYLQSVLAQWVRYYDFSR